MADVDFNCSSSMLLDDNANDADGHRMSAADMVLLVSDILQFLVSWPKVPNGDVINDICIGIIAKFKPQNWREMDFKFLKRFWGGKYFVWGASRFPLGPD